MSESKEKIKTSETTQSDANTQNKITNKLGIFGKIQPVSPTPESSLSAETFGSISSRQGAETNAQIMEHGVANKYKLLKR